VFKLREAPSELRKLGLKLGNARLLPAKGLYQSLQNLGLAVEGRGDKPVENALEGQQTPSQGLEPETGNPLDEALKRGVRSYRKAGRVPFLQLEGFPPKGPLDCREHF
jgi:hypothetical protein